MVAEGIGIAAGLAHAAPPVASRETRVTTVSMAFAESRIDERPYARTVADHIGSDHHEVLIRQSEGAFKKARDGSFFPGFGLQTYKQSNFYHDDFSFLKLNYERQTLMKI